MSSVRCQVSGVRGDSCDLDVICPSNRANQNLDFCAIFAISTLIAIFSGISLICGKMAEYSYAYMNFDLHFLGLLLLHENFYSY